MQSRKACGKYIQIIEGLAFLPLDASAAEQVKSSPFRQFIAPASCASNRRAASILSLLDVNVPARTVRSHEIYSRFLFPSLPSLVHCTPLSVIRSLLEHLVSCTTSSPVTPTVYAKRSSTYSPALQQDTPQRQEPSVRYDQPWAVASPRTPG